MPRRTAPDPFELAAGLPQDRACAIGEARDLGLSHRHLELLVASGLARRPINGVYLAAAVPDTMQTRLEVLRLTVPDGCVVVDQTAGWLWAGDRMLAPGDHRAPSPLSVFCPPGHRLRNAITVSGERRLRTEDTVEIDGLLVTVPLRTACDLGRLLHRDQALAALDTLARVGGFTVEQLTEEAGRYRGYRGVVQLRTLVVVVDPRSQSQGESILRLRWLDVGLPRPECQVEVPTPWGSHYALDIGLEEELFAAEYDGEEFHGDDRGPHDAARRKWLQVERSWTIVVARNADVTGQRQDIHLHLRVAWEARPRRVVITR